MVRFVDRENQVARKVSQHYEVSGPLPAIEPAKAGDVIFYREPELPAGVYTMETVVHDAPSGKSSVRLSDGGSPADDPAGLRMSSLVIVKRGEKVGEGARRRKSAVRQRRRALSQSRRSGQRKAKEVASTSRPTRCRARPGVRDRAGAERRDDRSDADAAAAADTTGRIQQVGRLPIGELTPGTYELRAVVSQGSEGRSGRAF